MTAAALGLRPYQLEACAAVRATWETPDAPDPLLVMATGTGKTRTAHALISETLARGGRVAVLAHREELLLQFAALFPGVAGIVQAGRNEPRRRVVCASVATLANPKRVAAILDGGPFDLIVIDEAHHTPSPTHTAAVAALRTPGRTRVLGLTATPDREDGADLGAIFSIAYDYGTVAAVRDGWLVPPYAAVVRLPGVDSAALAALPDEEQGKRLIAAHVVEHTVAAILGSHPARRLPDPEVAPALTLRAADVPLLVFTASVEQARLTAEALDKAGIVARHVSGETPRGDRERLLAAFMSGKIQALCNAGVLTEGTDLPPAAAVVLARAFSSWSLFVQSVGRGLRLHVSGGWDNSLGLLNAHHEQYLARGGKSHALVLDLAGATETHSLIAAPVLLSAPGCEHEWEPCPEPSTKAVCRLCDATVACAARLGPHEYGADGLCVTCRTPQCAPSPSARHLWTPIDDATRAECCFCGAVSREPLASLVSGRATARPEPVPRDAWLRVDPADGVVALVIDDHGLLYSKRARPAQFFDLYWLPKGARTLRPIGRTVSSSEAAALTADITRKAARFTDRGPVRPGTRSYAEKARRSIEGAATEGEARRALALEHARARWVATTSGAES